MPKVFAPKTGRPGKCERCGRTGFAHARVNHPLDLTLTICTLGIWSVSWLAVSLGDARSAIIAPGAKHPNAAMQTRT